MVKRKFWNYLKPELNRDKDDWKNTAFCVVLSTIFILLMYISYAPGTRASKATFIITFVIFLANVFLIMFKSFKNLKLHQVAFWTILILGTLSLLIQPIANIPDEMVHISRSEATSRLRFFFTTETGVYESVETIPTIFANVRKTYLEAREAMSQPIDTTASTFSSMVRANIFFVYLPQGLGMAIAKLFHMNNMMLLWLGRFFNLLAYSFLVGLTLKIMPKFKMPMFFIAALPMSIQQAASCSPDAMMNALSFLLIGYFVYLLCNEKILIGKKHILIYVLLAALASVAKLNNIVFSALIFAIPKWRFEKPKHITLLKWIIVVIPVLLGAGYYAFTQSFPAETFDPNSYTALNNVYPSQQYEYIFNNFFEWLGYFISSMINNLHTHMLQLNSFGWLDQMNPFMTIAVIFIFGYLCLKEERTSLSLWSKIFILLIILGDYALINLALYVTWTPVGSHEIWGVQGRYLIPLISLMPIIFARKQKRCNETGIMEEETITSVQLTRLVAAISTLSAIMLLMVTTKYYIVHSVF